MSTGAAIFVIFEIIAVVLLAFGYLYEDKFIEAEDNIITSVKEGIRRLLIKRALMRRRRLNENSAYSPALSLVKPTGGDSHVA